MHESCRECIREVTTTIFQDGLNHLRSGGSTARNTRILSLDMRLRAAVFLAERDEAIVGYAEIIEGALPDVTIAGASGENKEVTTVALARRVGDRYSEKPVDHCEIPGILTVIGNQLGLATVRPAVAAIVGESHAVRAVGALRLGHSRLPIAGVALPHGSAGGEGKGRNCQRRCDESTNVSGHFLASQ